MKAQLKSDTSSYKRSVREMETQVQQSTAVSTKCEREYLTLRDSIKHLSEGWKTDVDKLKKEMNEREGILAHAELDRSSSLAVRYSQLSCVHIGI